MGLSSEVEIFYNYVLADEVREIRPNPNGVLTF
jgi:hypothetical protein